MQSLWFGVVAVAILIFGDVPSGTKISMVLSSVIIFSIGTIQQFRRRRAAQAPVRQWFERHGLAKRSYRLRDALSDPQGQPLAAVAPDRHAMVLRLSPDRASPEIIAGNVVSLGISHDSVQNGSAPVRELRIDFKDGLTISLEGEPAALAYRKISEWCPGLPGKEV